MDLRYARACLRAKTRSQHRLSLASRSFAAVRPRPNMRRLDRTRSRRDSTNRPFSLTPPRPCSGETATQRGSSPTKPTPSPTCSCSWYSKTRSHHRLSLAPSPLRNGQSPTQPRRDCCPQRHHGSPARSRTCARRLDPIAWFRLQRLRSGQSPTQDASPRSYT
jgi:hypothetical protein